MIFFYHLLSIFAAILLVPLFSLTALFSKYKWKGLPHHFGWVPSKTRPCKKTLWLQALSMGEVVAATPVLKQLREQNPELYIALSVTTDSGYTTALDLGMVDSVFFHPLDCLPFTQLALNRLDPDLYVVTDTGFWPGLIDLLHRKKIPALLINGRISERSARRYLRAGFLFKETFQKFQHLCMQNTNGEKAALTLGAHREFIEVMGDPKYDALQPMSNEEKEQFRQTFKLNAETPVWIAGSTHSGEEEIILKAHRQLIIKHPDLVLILAPRRMERVEEVTALLKKESFSFSLRSSPAPVESASVILLDTMGELAQIYSLGQVAFIGNSLIKPGGGHSLIEPLSHGLAVLHGPYVENISHVSEIANSQELAFPIANHEELEEKVHTLLENVSQRLEITEKTKAFIAQQQGAAKKTTAIITKYLGVQPPSY
jgi:3-deoxy-D-manno-octulosonic-acid transferase